MAGGMSLRMGRDKAFLGWQGTPLWQSQLAKLRALTPARLLVSCRIDQELDPGGQAERILDPPGETMGPAAAIARCLEQVQMPLLVLAVDMPWMTSEFLRHDLVAKMTAGKGLFYRQGGRFEPLAGIYTPAMLPLLIGAIADNQFSLQPIVAAAVNSGIADALEMNTEGAPFFRNANTPEDWRR